MNSDKIIIDLCGGTGAWSDPYKQAGYDVRVITLPDYDVCNFAPAVELGPDVYRVYGIFAAPPCTHFSFARNGKVQIPRDINGAFKTVHACLSIIWYWQKQEPKFHLKFWALENPRGYLRRLLGKPVLHFNPCDYGDPWTKATDIWGFFNIPIKNKVAPASCDPNRWTTESRFTSKDKLAIDCSEEYYNKVRGERRIIRRAITPPGFAKAFFRANR